MFRRKKTLCRSCPGKNTCEVAGMRPSLGRCSFVPADVRTSVLKVLRTKVQNDGTCYLKRPVVVTVDDCGMDFRVAVRLVRPFPGVKDDALVFGLGKGGRDEETSTDLVSTDDLKRILEELQPWN